MADMRNEREQDRQRLERLRTLADSPLTRRAGSQVNSTWFPLDPAQLEEADAVVFLRHIEGPGPSRTTPPA